MNKTEYTSKLPQKATTWLQMKTYQDNSQIGKVRHSVSFHDGIKVHKDGSPFFDLQTFTKRKEKEKFIRDLKNSGYISKTNVTTHKQHN